MTLEILLSALAVAGTTWGAWLTYRGIVTKTRQDAHAANFRWMQEEIGRLRDDLTERDREARSSYDEVMTLRKEVHGLMLRVHRLHTLLTVYVEGSRALFEQVIEADLIPVFDPTAVDTSGLSEED